MDGTITILVAIIGSAGTVIAALIGARQIAGRKARSSGGNANPIAAQWKEQAELEKARADLLAEQLVEEREGRAADAGVLERERQRLAATQHDLDDCARQRDNAYATIRAIERRRQPRSPGA